MRWYSAMVVVTSTIEGFGQSSFWRSVFVFRAIDRQAAKAKALELGRALEDDYLNGSGARVKNVLNRVDTLDELGEEIEDGLEVWSEGILVDEPPFNPFAEPPIDLDNSEPGSAGVGKLA